MVGRALVEPQTQEGAHRQRVGGAPSDAALGVAPFEIADQQQAEVPAGGEARPPHHRRVERATLLNAVPGPKHQWYPRHAPDLRERSARDNPPVIVMVDSTPAPGLLTHWVVLYAKDGSDYLMLDPWPYQTDVKKKTYLMPR
jgi:hypothetical protein